MLNLSFVAGFGMATIAALGLNTFYTAQHMADHAASRETAYLPLCPTEDSANCIWNANNRGNWKGRSLIDYQGRLFLEAETDLAAIAARYPAPVESFDLIQVSETTEGGLRVDVMDSGLTADDCAEAVYNATGPGSNASASNYTACEMSLDYFSPAP